MNKLYRLVWDDPKTGKKQASWWSPSLEATCSDKDRVETEYGVKTEIEERDF